MGGLEIIDMFADVGNHVGVGILGDFHPAVALRQGDDAVGDRHPAEHLAPPPATQAQPDQLRAAAADIEDERIAVAVIDERRAAFRRQRRLLRRGDDIELDPAFLGDAGEKLLAVARLAADLRRDAAHMGDADATHLVRADAERLDGSVHRPLRQLAGQADALAKADNARETVDDAKALALPFRNQQPAVVGAKVKRAVDVGGMFPAIMKPASMSLALVVTLSQFLGFCNRHPGLPPGQFPQAPA